MAKAALPPIAVTAARQAKLRRVAPLRHPEGKRRVGVRLRRWMCEPEPKKGGQQQE